MSNMTIPEFQSAVEEILDVPPGTLEESSSRETLASWSSLADVKIVALLASECGIEPDAELLEAETYGDLLRLLRERNAFASTAS